MFNKEYCSHETNELAKVMLQIQIKLKPAIEDETNNFTHSSYASLNSIMSCCIDTLNEYGVWLHQYPVPVETGQLGLVTKITHAESGQWQSSLLVMPLAKTDPQGYGSALTYARRYGISTVLGIVTERDDDGIRARYSQKESRDLNQNKKQTQSYKVLSAMPQLDGIQYQLANTENGEQCIIASGNTRDKKEILKQAGFRWSPQRKLWWRYAKTA